MRGTCVSSLPAALDHLNGAGVTLCEEAAPPSYWKVRLNGGLDCDPDPCGRSRSDQEAEETYVDALTLQLCHQVRDIYVPLLESDFALSVRRNIFGSAWTGNGELAPAARLDRPFGDCWRSGLGASVHVIDRGGNAPVHVESTDEQGTVHRFVAVFEAGRCVGYHSLPNAGHEQDSGSIRLTRDTDSNWLLRRKFGTTLTYTSTALVREALDASGSRVEHRFHRLQSVVDARGVRIEYSFAAANDGVIPDEVRYLTLSIRVERNSNGYVSRLVDPRGIDTLLRYRDSVLPGGAALLVAVERPGIPGKRDCIGYDYEEVVEAGAPGSVDREAYHTCIRRITDARGYAHEFEYAFDDSRIELAAGVERRAKGTPRCLIKSILPAGLGCATFASYSTVHPNPAIPSRRITWVADAEGNGRLYHFPDPSVITLANFPFWKDASFQASALPRRGLRYFAHWKSHTAAAFGTNSCRNEVKFGCAGPQS
jgi:hypothetical protein